MSIWSRFSSRSEELLVGLMIAGVLFKMFRWPFASVLFVIAAASLLVLYLLLPKSVFKPSGTEVGLPWLSALAGMACAVPLAGTTCLIMHWPHAKHLLIAAVVVCALVAGLTWSRVPATGGPYFYRSAILLRATAWGALAFVLAVLFPVN